MFAVLYIVFWIFILIVAVLVLLSALFGDKGNGYDPFYNR